MNVVDVLFQGYSRVSGDNKFELHANATCSLVRGKNVNILVDTLTPWDAASLMEALKERDLTPDSFTHVICTHGHSDHIGNLNQFLKATLIVGKCVSRKDVYFLDAFDEGSFKITDDIIVTPTPGHTLADVSVIVRNTALGTVVLAGDLFEREEDISSPLIWQSAGSDDPKVQVENRRKVLSMADYIVPGHGPMFKVTDHLKELHERSISYMDESSSS